VSPQEKSFTLSRDYGSGNPARSLLFALVTLGVVVGPAVATAAQLNLNWVDNSGGQAGFIIQRETGTTGTYTQVAQTALGAVSYSDATVSLGTTYCYRVAAVNSAGTSDFSNLACGSPSRRIHHHGGQGRHRNRDRRKQPGRDQLWYGLFLTPTRRARR